MNEQQRILSQPDILPGTIRYHVVGTAIALTLTIVGILVLPLALPVVYFYYRRYYANLKVVLTTRDLQIDRGVWIREEKRIPLEKITDLATFQGPLMRRMGLKGLRVETAGQTGGTSGALVTVIGLEDTQRFREWVLRQRDRVTDATEDSGEPHAAGDPNGIEQRLIEIRDTLVRIEQHLHRE